MKKLNTNILQRRTQIRILTFFLLLSFSYGCFQHFYKVSESDQLQNEDILKFQDENKMFIVHYLDTKCLLKDPYIVDNHLKGWVDTIPSATLKNLESPETILEKHRYHKNAKLDNSEIANMVHFYVDQPFQLYDSLDISTIYINKIEITDKNKAATLFSWIGPPIVIGTAIAIIAASSSSSEPAPPPPTSPNSEYTSCPFVFTTDGTQFTFEGEAYAGSIFPSLERNDYMLLTGLKPIDGKYHLFLNNQNKEIQNTNLTWLKIIDCPQNTFVVMDKHGEPQFGTSLQLPLSVVDDHGQQQLDKVSVADGVSYFSVPEINSNSYTDELVFTFNRPEQSKKCKLFIRARNSILLDYALLKYTQMYGDNYEQWYSIVSRKSGKKLSQWKSEQKFPLEVYMEVNGHWRYIDCFNPCGPMAFRNDVLNIPIPNNLSGETMKIKLTSGKAFWEIDQVQMDFGANLQLGQLTLKPESAVDQNGEDVLGLLANDDNQYLVQPAVGDETEIIFNAPELQSQMNRCIFLNSKGHYKIIGNKNEGHSLVYMYQFNLPGRFTRFVHENYYSLVGTN